MNLPSLRLIAGALAPLALLAVGCGSQPTQSAAPSARLVLDFTPNAVHSGTYLTHQRGWDRAAGVNLKITAPASSGDALKLLSSDAVDLAFLDIHDLAIADQRHPGKLVAVMALVQRPLAAVLAEPGVKRPRELEGQRAGVSGLPSDLAVLNSIVAGDGGNPARVKQVTIGFQAVASLISGRVAAATAFWNVEGEALRALRPETNQFRVEDYGAPSYPELLLVTTREILSDDPAMVDAAIVALRRGYEAVIAAPESGVQALVAGVPSVDKATTRRELAAVLPAFKLKGEKFGVLDSVRLERWAAWEKRFGIVSRRPNVERLFSGPNLIPAPLR